MAIQVGSKVSLRMPCYGIPIGEDNEVEYNKVAVVEMQLHGVYEGGCVLSCEVFGTRYWNITDLYEVK